MLPWPKMCGLPQLWIFLLLFVSKSAGSQPEQGICSDGDCNISTLQPVQLSAKDESGLLDISSSSIVESTTEVTTIMAEGTIGGAETTSELLMTTRDSRDLTVSSTDGHLPPTVTSTDGHSPPTALPALEFPAKRRRMETSNRSHPFGDHCPCDLLFLRDRLLHLLEDILSYMSPNVCSSILSIHAGATAHFHCAKTDHLMNIIPTDGLGMEVLIRGLLDYFHWGQMKALVYAYEVGSCDLNCCCDVLDCSEEEKEAFSNCLPLPSAVSDPRLCNQYRWVSTPNHSMQLQIEDTHQPSFLCISRDNNPGRLALTDYSPARSLKDFQELTWKRPSFRWPTPILSGVHFAANSSYKAGDALWMVHESSLFPLELASSGFSSLCQSKKLVRFLEDWKSSCVLPLPLYAKEEGEPRSSMQMAALKESCLALGVEPSLRSATILSSPLHWPNTSASHSCPPDICIRAQQWMCGSLGFDDCVEVENIPPSVLRGDSCLNVLITVRLVVDVLGVGIRSAQVYSVLSNVSLSGEAWAISRGHSVVFKWWSSEEDIGAEYDKDRIVWKRSGSPGYIIGAPIMAGWKETVVLGGEDSRQRDGDGLESGVLEAIRVTPHPDGWLTMLGPVAGTQACGGPRKAVQFGHSARWSCLIPVFPSDLTADGCAALKKKALSLLLGWDSAGNLSERFIAMFGDSLPERLGEWLPLRIISHDGKEVVDWSRGEMMGKGCSGLHTNVHLEIATALVGSVSNPQAKVLGAILRMGTPLDLLESRKLWHSVGKGGGVMTSVNVTSGRVEESLNVRGGKGRLHLMLVSSVNFVDVTSAPVMEVAPPPVYHIRLPHNFFHPFLSSLASSFNKCALRISVLIVPMVVCVSIEFES